MKQMLLVSLMTAALFAAPPSVGEKAPDFTLKNLDGRAVKLSGKTAKGQVVLIVLRGFPGYQCPLCNRQVKEFVSKAAEFVMDKNLPAGFELVLDPDYKFTTQYGLRWDAPQETAYPSTFLIDSKGMVFFSKISKTHGGRTTTTEILEALQK